MKNILAHLIVVCVLKQVFSLHEICDLINIQMESCPIEVAYDYFCDETEQAIKSVFFTRDFSKTSKSSNYTRESEILKQQLWHLHINYILSNN